MNKRFIGKAIACLILVAATIIGVKVSAKAVEEIPDYTGSVSTPHPITNKYELASIGSNVFGKIYPLDGNYIQTQDIVFTEADFAQGGDFYNDGKGWKPIGINAASSFNGIYNGGGYAIENIYINRPAEENIGIFGYGNVNAKLYNLGNKKGNITGKGKVGGLVGTGFNVVENCYNTGNVTAVATGSTNTASGIVGYSIVGVKSRIANCYNEGNITSQNNANGIVDSSGNDCVGIQNCYNTGNVVSKSADSAGIISSAASTPIENCYNTGSVKGSTAGGIVGRSTGVITKCFNKGSILGTTAGGIAGNINTSSSANGYISECFNSGVVNGGTSGGISGTGNGTPNINSCYNTGQIIGGHAAGIANRANIYYCYSAGEIIGQTYAGALGAYSTDQIAFVNSYYDEVKTNAEEAYPGSQAGKLTTETMTGNTAFANMMGINTDMRFVINSNGYPQLKTFAESLNPVFKEESNNSTETSSTGGGDNPGEGDNPGGGDDNDKDSATSSGEIIGTVQPSQIKAVVPTIITFEINPDKELDYEGKDGEDSFISPSFSFKNGSNISLDFIIERISAKTNMPEVVANDKYTDEQWQALGRADTNSNIAFGFKLENTSQWLSAANANNWYANAAYRFGTLGASNTANLRLKGKYGLNWGNAQAKQITYDVVYKVAAVK